MFEFISISHYSTILYNSLHVYMEQPICSAAGRSSHGS